MQYILERFEEETAIIEVSSEDGITFREVPRAELPEDTAEGDILLWQNECWYRDTQATEARRDAMAQRLKRMGLL